MAAEVRVPTLGESIVEATVGTWLKHEGDPIAAGEALVELETDKVSIEVTAEQSGVLEQIMKNEGQNVGIGEVLARIRTEPANDVAARQSEESTVTSTNRSDGETATASASADQHSARLPVSPVARRMAIEEGIDLQGITGSGPSGRITKDDVAAHLAPPPVPAPPTMPVEQPRLSDIPRATEQDRREERVRMSRRRQTIARRLVEAQQTAAMLTTFNEIDMSAVIELRKRHQQAFQERHGIKLGFMSFFTKAAIGALRAFPLLNAEIQNDQIVIKHYYDIGVAIATPEGLVVPVLRDSDRKSFAEIELAIAELAAHAHAGTLSLPELQGGTFTITNGGIFGSLMSTPILNTPQVGILGMHKIMDRAIALNGQVVIRPMMYVALSYDHRIVDGSEAVRFLVRIKELIEDPEALMLEG